jgi:hypothetical protein
MTTHPKHRSTESKLTFALLCVVALSTQGCFTKKPPAAHLAAIHLGAPVVPEPNAEQLSANPPDIPFDEPPAFPQLTFGRNVPPRPRVAPTPAPEPSRTERSKEPTIVPEVTTEEMFTAKNESEQSLHIAERNLLLAAGKSLNAAQQDLVSKVHGFSDSAREAMKSGDWARAKTLSKKAEVLSAQLVSSL